MDEGKHQLNSCDMSDWKRQSKNKAYPTTLSAQREVQSDDSDMSQGPSKAEQPTSVCYFKTPCVLRDFLVLHLWHAGKEGKRRTYDFTWSPRTP